MHKVVLWSLCAAAGSGACLWAADWPSTGGNPQRDGWSQGETIFSVASVSAGKVKQLWKYQFDNKADGLTAMTNPIVLSRLIGYHGFEELVLANGSDGASYAIDADLGRAYFKTPFPSQDKGDKARTTALCPGGITSSMTMFGQSAVLRFGGFGGANPIARLAPYFTVSADGYVRTRRAQDGQAEMISPAKMLPPNSNVTGLNFSGSTLYAATINGCGGSNGLYADDFTPPKLPARPDLPMVEPSKWTVESFLTNGAGFSGTGGVAAGTKNDIVFGTVPNGRGDVAGSYSDTVLALEAKSLTVKDWFTPIGCCRRSRTRPASDRHYACRLCQSGQGLRDCGRPQRPHLYTGRGSPGQLGPSHVTVRYSPIGLRVEPGKWHRSVRHLCNPHTRRATMGLCCGARTGDHQVSGGKATAPNGSIVAFKLSMTKGRPVLTPAWSSRDLLAPMAPATANGLVFALSSGMPTRPAKQNGTLYSADEVAKMSKSAVLYILNAATGK